MSGPCGGAITPAAPPRAALLVVLVAMLTLLGACGVSTAEPPPATDARADAPSDGVDVETTSTLPGASSSAAADHLLQLLSLIHI